MLVLKCETVRGVVNSIKHFRLSNETFMFSSYRIHVKISSRNRFYPPTSAPHSILPFPNCLKIPNNVSIHVYTTIYIYNEINSSQLLLPTPATTTKTKHYPTNCYLSLSIVINNKLTKKFNIPMFSTANEVSSKQYVTIILNKITAKPRIPL